MKDATPRCSKCKRDLENIGTIWSRDGKNWCLECYKKKFKEADTGPTRIKRKGI